MKKIISLTGKPGAGKGTRLSKFLEGREGEFEVLSVGNMLRREVSEETELGMQAKAYMDTGKLVPDYLIVNMVLEEIKKAKKSIILDGFPRTVGQAEAALEGGIKITKGIDIYVSDEEVLRRSENRIVCVECGETYTRDDYKLPKSEGFCDKCGGELHRRSDDRRDVVLNRLKTYDTETKPVLEVLRNSGINIVSLDGEKDNNIDEKFAKEMLS